MSCVAPSFRTWRTISASLVAFLTACARPPSGDCTSFATTTVAGMRTLGENGCVELSGVVVEGRTPSGTAPRLFVSDPAGGPFAAIMAKCSASEEPRCSADAKRTIARVLRGGVVTLRGYYWKGATSGFEELVLQELEDSGVLAEPPAPVPLVLGAASRHARSPESWFHRVTIPVADGAPLVVVERSPPELRSGEPCPLASGFALASVEAAPEAPGCDGDQPAQATTPVTGALLVGRAFFRDFTWSTDCACAAEHHQRLVPAQAVFTGSLAGILTFVRGEGSPDGAQVLEPQTNADVSVGVPQ